MAKSHIGRLLVVQPTRPEKLLGIITRSDLLKARLQSVEEEEVRGRPIVLGGIFKALPKQG